MTGHIDKKEIKVMIPPFIRLIAQLNFTGETNYLKSINPTFCIRRAMLTARYLLLLVTSFFYLAGPPQSPLGIKIMVVIAMLVAVFLAQSLYNHKEIEEILYHLYHLYNPYKIVRQENARPCKSSKPHLLLILIGIEIIGTALVALPTGGLDSPFVWCALNPILASAFYLRSYSSWLTMGSFLSVTLLFRKTLLEITTPVVSDLLGHLTVLMFLCFFTALAQIFAALFKELAWAYSQLEAAHKESQNALAHNSSLYQALEACSTGEDHVQIADILAEYATRLCHRPAACFIAKENEAWGKCTDSSKHLRIAGESDAINYEAWEHQMNQLWNQVCPNLKAVLLCDWDHNYSLICQPLNSHGECFGILACMVNRQEGDHNYEKSKSLSFLAGLGGITLERLQADKLYGRLLVSEEQNRIANEIHDGVAQYLFSMVCSVHTLSLNDLSLQDFKVQQQLKLLEDLASRASKELKASIYELSPRKRGERIFVETINSYLDDLGRLHGIQVDLQVEGCEEVISPTLRKALYRMVREACSNALRHGKCHSLKVSLSMYPGQTVMEVKDNGSGWKAKKLKDENIGLGIVNMMQTAELFGGKLEIESLYGTGTTIRCIIPKTDSEIKKEGKNYETAAYR